MFASRNVIYDGAHLTLWLDNLDGYRKDYSVFLSGVLLYYYCCIVYPNSFCQPHNIPTKPQTIDRVYAVQWTAILIKSVWAFSFRDLVTIFWGRFGFDFFSLFHLIYYLNILTEITLFTSMRLINYVWIWV